MKINEYEEELINILLCYFKIVPVFLFVRNLLKKETQDH